MNDTKGSIWRKWDLHIHTKYSQESSAKLEVIDIFKSAIEKGIEVISITDHSNVDALDEIWNVWETQSVTIDGKDTKISEAIDFLPGCELKTDMGKHGIHIISVFPKEFNGTRIDKSYLELQFLSKINCSHQDVANTCAGDFSKGIFQVTVDFEKTSDLVRKLGGLVIVHAGQKSNGIEKEMAHAKDESDSYQIWNSLGAKKTELMKKYIDICELPNATENSIKEARFYLEKFNKPSIISSDSHESYEGLQYTWIKADPTILGLKQITYEPLTRVCVERVPQVLDRVRGNKTKYISKLIIDQIQGYSEAQGIWFKKLEIPLNGELVAIIGNKGSGKSAIADIIGLLGNSKKSSHFSFLNDGKFKKRGYAENFKAELIWEDKTPYTPLLLNSEVDKTKVERVRYLPQNYFESLTNSLNSENFEKTLRDVIFLNIPESDRLGWTTFDDLEKAKKRIIELDIIKLKDELKIIIGKIVKLEDKQHPDNKAKLKNQIAEKEKELAEHIKTKPDPVKDPVIDSGKTPEDPIKKAQLEKLSQLNLILSKIVADIELKNQELSKLKQDEEKLKSISSEIDRFGIQYDTLKNEHKEALVSYDIDIDKLFKLKINLAPIAEKLASIQLDIRKTTLLLDSAATIDSYSDLTDQERTKFKLESLLVQRDKTKKEIGEIKNVLSKPEKDFQEYSEKLTKWEAKRKEIEGVPTKLESGSLLFLKKENVYITTQLDKDHESLQEIRVQKALEIFNKKKEILALYNSLKQSIDQQLADRSDLAEKFKIEINSGFNLHKDFPSEFLEYIHKSKSGTFRSANESKVLELFKDKDLTLEVDIQNILEKIILLLNEDQSENIEVSKRRRYISDQVAKLHNFYEYIFSLDYLLPVYDLRLDGKKLGELSPGERGALLLVFYLIIDKEDIPLVIDQPEDNLDNKSVFEILTHFIKLAKSRRQIIIVTHNPNLAIGADAEQILYVEIEKKNSCKFVYEAGGIENPRINNRIVEILEGTMPAFEKRELKYIKVQK